MFKKKPALPARPMPPAFELIEEDINGAPSDDVVFATNPSEILQTENKTRNLSVDSKDSYENGMESDNEDDTDSDPDVLYNKVKTFVDVNNSLKTSINSFHEWYNALLRNGQSLRKQTEEVKEQISKALQERNIENNHLLFHESE